VDELAVNLASEVVDDRYLEVLIVVQAAVAKVPGKLLAVRDGFQVSFELDPDPVSHRDAVFHVEKEFSHGQCPVSRMSANLVRPLRNHASALNRVSDGTLLAAFDGALRLQPGLRHHTFDDVHLNSSADRASKRSQIPPRTARLNRRKLHGRTASGALRALVLSFEHGSFLNAAL
jgi:hypothetical protein